MDAEVGYPVQLIKLVFGVRNLFDLSRPSISDVVVDDETAARRRTTTVGGLAVRVQRTIPVREDGDSAGLVGGAAGQGGAGGQTAGRGVGSPD